MHNYTDKMEYAYKYIKSGIEKKCYQNYYLIRTRRCSLTHSQSDPRFVRSSGQYHALVPCHTNYCVHTQWLHKRGGSEGVGVTRYQ